MADRSLNVRIAGDATSLLRAFQQSGQSAETFAKRLKTVDRAHQDNVRSSAKLHTAFGNIYGRGGALFAAAGGLYGLKKGVESVTTAYAESQVSQQKLQAQLKASGLSYRAHAAEIDRVIQKTSKLAGLDDEDLQDAFTNIVRVTGNVNKSLRLTGLAADFARAKHMDVAKAGELVGKVAGGNIGILSRYGIQLDKGASATEALATLQRKFAGQADAYGKTQAGATERLQVAWENLQESLGAKVAPAITDVFNRLADVGNQIDGISHRKDIDLSEKIKLSEDVIRRKLGPLVTQVEDAVRNAHLGQRLEDAIVAVSPVLIKQAALIGVKSAKAFAHAWLDSDLLTRVVLGGWLLKKTGAFRLFRQFGTQAGFQAASGFQTSFAAGTAATGVGRGGVAAGAARAGAGVRVGGALRGLGAGAAAAFGGPVGIGVAGGLIFGPSIVKAALQPFKSTNSQTDTREIEKAQKALARLQATGDLPGLRHLATNAHDVARELRAFGEGDAAKKLDQIGKAAQTASAGPRELRSQFQRMRSGSITSIEDLRKNVLYNTHLIRSGAAGDAKHTADAMAENFNAGIKAVKRGMRDGSISVKDGMKEIRQLTRDNMKLSRDSMADLSQDGRTKLAQNFRSAANAVQTQMQRGKVSTREGMQQIRSYLTKELQVYGFSLSEARNVAKGNSYTGGPEEGTRGPGHARGGRIKRDAGGWIGDRGMVGTDTVPAMLAPGEAVLNRHQQAVVEGILGNGFLDKLFSTVDRPHYLAKGGRVQRFAKGGGVGGAVQAANQLDRAHFPYRWGGGHQATPAPFGPVDCSGAVSYVLQHAGVNIPTMTSGQLMNAGQPGPGALTVYANPEHTIMRIGDRFFGTSGSNPGGGAGWMPNPGSGYLSRFAVRHFMGGGGGGFGVNVKTPQIKGGGAVGRLVQRALGMAAGAASKFGTNAVGAMGLGKGDPNNPATGYGKGQLRNLWVRAGGSPNVANLMAAIALAESRGDPNAHNRSGATGLWQILGNPFPGNAYNPATNARMAVAKYRSQGLGAWEAYTNGSYRQFLARGGRVKGYARGRRPAKRTASLRGSRWNGIAAARHRPSSFRTTLPLINAAIAEAALTPTLDDDIEAAGALEHYWQSKYRAAKRSGNAGAITRTATELSSARSNLSDLRASAAPGDLGADPNQGLIDAMAALTEAQQTAAALEQQRIDLEKQMVTNQNKLITLQNTQGPQLLSAVIAAVNGGIGGRVGLGFQTPGFAGGVSRT